MDAVKGHCVEFTVYSAEEVDLRERPGLRKQIHASYEAIFNFCIFRIRIARRDDRKGSHSPHLVHEFQHAGSVVVENLLVARRTFRGVARAASQALIREGESNYNKAGVDRDHLLKAVQQFCRRVTAMTIVEYRSAVASLRHTEARLITTPSGSFWIEVAA